MSSGFNGIPIRSAEIINEKLGLKFPESIDAEDLQRTNPHHRHFEDCCAWDCWTNEFPRRHIYSWATMTHCVKHGIALDLSDPFDIEV